MKFALIGIDDCARMPVLGNMFVAGILIPLDKIELLKKIKVKDSKLCTKKQITDKAKKLMKYFKYFVAEITPQQISEYNMNDLEAKAFYEVWNNLVELARLNKEKVIVYADNFDYSREKFINRFKNLKLEIDEDKWVIQHDCDKNYAVCSAASIIAKYHHSLHEKELKKIYGDIGNLNPGNPKTVAFIEANLKNLPPIVRKSYITVKRLYNKQNTLFL